MASKDTSRARGRGRRQTRSGRVSASDEDDFAEIPTVKRTTRRTSVVTVEPKAHVGDGSEDIGIHEIHDTLVQGPPAGAQENGDRHAEPPTTSEKLRDTARRVRFGMQDTLSSAIDNARINWRTIGTLLLLAVLASLLMSRLARPDFTKLKTSDIDRVEQRCKSLLKKLQDAEERLDATEGKMQQFDRMFEQGSSDDGMVLSKKADPNVILNLAEQRVQSALERFAADKTGLVDYALAPAGGRVISHSQLYPRPDDPAITTWSQIGAALVPGAAPAVHPKADKFILTPGGPVPGECLPLNGTMGEVVIHLREPIIPTAVTYEHVPSAITYDFRSAPRDLSVVGWLSEAVRVARKKGSWLPVLEHRRPVPPRQIGSFTYDFAKTNLQTVAVDSDAIVDHIRFQVRSNYGRPDYTCIYRVRVHGIAPGEPEAGSVQEAASASGSASSGSF